jgi:hypothetical protein
VSLGNFSALVGGVLLVTMSGLAVAVRGGSDAAATTAAAVAGALLAALNAIGAFALVLWSRDKNTGTFMRAILGGMTVRMGFLVAASGVALRILGLAQGAFVSSLLIHFAVFLALELTAAHRSMPPRQVTR